LGQKVAGIFCHLFLAKNRNIDPPGHRGRRHPRGPNFSARNSSSSGSCGGMLKPQPGGRHPR
jgi:hypothetical protein